MDAPSSNDTLKQLGVGGGTFLTALWLFLKYKPWRGANGHAKGTTSGELPPTYWDSKFDRLAEIGERQTEILERFTASHEDMRRDIIRILERTPPS